MDERHRELGTIAQVQAGKEEDHNVLVCWLHIDFDKGGRQGFGGTILSGEMLTSYTKELCRVFGVLRFDLLVGQKCYALRSWSDKWGQKIEGVESFDTGRRFVLTKWLRDQGIPRRSPLRERRAELEHELAAMQHRRSAVEQEMADLEVDYIDWTNPPQKEE